jgi:hypothetical protein
MKGSSRWFHYTDPYYGKQNIKFVQNYYDINFLKNLEAEVFPI